MKSAPSAFVYAGIQSAALRRTIFAATAEHVSYAIVADAAATKKSRYGFM